MESQITASVFTEFEQGYDYLVTEYLAACGCRWKVDQWGNVRRAKPCGHCMDRRLEPHDQLVWEVILGAGP